MTFEKGQSRNPAGRPPGLRNKSTVLAETMLQGAAEEIYPHGGSQARRCVLGSSPAAPPLVIFSCLTSLTSDFATSAENNEFVIFSWRRPEGAAAQTKTKAAAAG